ncbi:MAG: ferritin [Dysgonamonadaceae bacterium]|jgi:ferritin|nr:ferritin [Dysgonamonadaceae bacterium]
MLKEKMKVALNKQVNAELWSSYLYLSMSYDMADKGFHGFEKWFASQAKEEFEHARKIAGHIQAMDGKVALEPIAEVRQAWNSPKDAFEDTLLHEKKVTEMIHFLYELATELKDYATVHLLQWFVDEQVEEEETARDILAAIQKIEKNEAAMYLLDQKLGNRA